MKEKESTGVLILIIKKEIHPQLHKLLRRIMALFVKVTYLWSLFHVLLSKFEMLIMKTTV